MGAEPVFFNKKYYIENNQIVSKVQKFMELYLKEYKHPEWFYEALDDLNSNFHIAHGKFFFDEELIDKENSRLDYAIKMIDLTLKKMESINKRKFIEYIRESLKGSWCDLKPESFYDENWMEENETYEKYYIGVLKSLKEIMNP
ncbi:hypothetical protein [Emticicia sp. SJ17W-69]|uniref:hypothetical protein n=1 Tax=Emticicia sp. SJ17W-69 TaxID=3421657 RepID=UPI003EBEC799